MRLRGCLCLILAGGPFIVGCTVTRPVAVGVEPTALAGYLAEHPHTNLRVSTRTGNSYWMHAPQVHGDSLIGRRGYDVPARSVTEPLTNVTDVGSSHFSLGRTAAAFGGAFVAAGAALLILVDEGAKPIY